MSDVPGYIDPTTHFDYERWRATALANYAEELKRRPAPPDTHADEREIRAIIAESGLDEPDLWLWAVADVLHTRAWPGERIRELARAACNIARVEGMKGSEPERIIIAAWNEAER
jgi:hypothetical protein